MKVTFEKFGQTFELDTDKLPADSVAYLLQYGYNQSLQDSIAGRAKAVGLEYAEECKKAGTVPDTAELTRLTQADLLGTLAKRSDAIAAGTVGVRTGVTRDSLKTIANEMVRAAIKKAGAQVSKEKFAELVDKLLSDKRDVVQAEADRRAAAKVDVDIDLDLD